MPKPLSFLLRPYILLPLCGLLLLALHGVLYPSSLPRIDLNLQSAVDRLRFVSLHKPPASPGSNQIDPEEQRRSCNPYLLPGVLDLNITDPWFSTYTPFPPAPCTPPNNLLHRLMQGTPSAGTKGASVLLVGDSVDRELVRFFHHAGKIQPLRPVPALSATEMTDSRQLSPYGNNGNNGYPRHVRYLDPGAEGFEVLNYHFCGLDQQGIWPDKQNPCNDPAPLMPRLEAFEQWFGTLERKPDLVVVQSSLWDIARFQRELYAADDGQPEPDGLSDKYVAQWIEDMSAFVRRIRSVVGEETKMVLRLMHEAKATEGTWFKPPGSTKDVLGPTFSKLRVHQIREAQRWVAQVEGVELMPFGDVMWGQREWLRDDIHPGIPGNAIYAEMVLEVLERVRG